MPEVDANSLFSQTVDTLFDATNYRQSFRNLSMFITKMAEECAKDSNVRRSGILLGYLFEDWMRHLDLGRAALHQIYADPALDPEEAKEAAFAVIYDMCTAMRIAEDGVCTHLGTDERLQQMVDVESAIPMPIWKITAAELTTLAPLGVFICSLTASLQALAHGQLDVGNMMFAVLSGSFSKPMLQLRELFIDDMLLLLGRVEELRPEGFGNLLYDQPITEAAQAFRDMQHNIDQAFTEAW